MDSANLLTLSPFSLLHSIAHGKLLVERYRARQVFELQVIIGSSGGTEPLAKIKRNRPAPLLHLPSLPHFPCHQHEHQPNTSSDTRKQSLRSLPAEQVASRLFLSLCACNSQIELIRASSSATRTDPARCVCVRVSTASQPVARQ